LFLSFKNLQLIIIDEEHENSYKQFDPSPRYNARNAAIYLAHIHQAKTLLGSATPSIESYYNAESGKYGFIQIKHRHRNLLLPEILIADLKEETKKKKMKSILSSLLYEAIESALKDGGQVILFQNRRGFVPIMECNTCNWVPRCVQCDVSLTYHKYNNQLRCHYCGYAMKAPNRCGACGNTSLLLKGLGTEKIVEETEILFPKAKVERMDFDTTRSKHAYHQIISDFEDKKIDILVGTQMVSKGLDFDNVSLVGIMNADSMLYYPDFRAFEHSFQLMAQVSGRAGRKNKRGKVIIQTFNPYHNVIQYVMHHDYEALYHSEIVQRRNFNYPPFYRLIEISVKHKDKDTTDNAAHHLASELKNILAKRVIGPEYPSINRIKNLYIKNIIVKLETGIALHKIKNEIKNRLVQFKLNAEFKSVRVTIDVDPQ
jgi:primosomal protein N' (replication factor Y)